MLSAHCVLCCRCIVKLVVDGKSDKVLGAHMCGADAAEIMQVGAIASLNEHSFKVKYKYYLLFI